MRKLKNFLLLAVTFCVAVGTFLFCTSKLEMWGMDGTQSALAFAPEDFSAQYHAFETNSSLVQNSSSQSAQSVNASGNVLGKIKEQFMSPYKAALSYNKVYIRNKTSHNINLKSELEQKLKFTINKNEGPQVLIVHTHTTESYMNEDRDYYTDADYSRSTDAKLNMIAIGEIFAKQLEDAGIKTVHDKTLHDYPSYSGSYSRSEKTIKANLAKYPSIKVVVDIHRDAIMADSTTKTKPVTEINGKKAAQVMLVMGSQDGSVKNFENWKENFRLAIKFQQTMEVMYPGLARPLVLAAKKYNENLTTGSMLLEVGTDANSFEEAKRSAELSGGALAALLNTIR